MPHSSNKYLRGLANHRNFVTCSGVIRQWNTIIKKESQKETSFIFRLIFIPGKKKMFRKKFIVDLLNSIFFNQRYRICHYLWMNIVKQGIRWSLGPTQDIQFWRNCQKYALYINTHLIKHIFNIFSIMLKK